MNKAHGKTLIIENNTNNNMINKMINGNDTGANITNGGYTSGNEDDGELISEQQHLDETYFASKIVDRVACDICNKQVCNKYFLRTHKQKVHGIYENSPSNGLTSSSENGKNKVHTSTNKNHRFNDEGEGEIIEDELQYEDEDDDDSNHDNNNMMIDENEDENEESAYRSNDSNNRKFDFNESGKELGELVSTREPGETFQENHVAKKQAIAEKNRRMSTCSNGTSTSKFFFFQSLIYLFFPRDY